MWATTFSTFSSTVVGLLSALKLLCLICAICYSNTETSRISFSETVLNHTVVIPFLNHVINNLSTRFSTHAKQVVSIQSLLPMKITLAFTMQNIEQAAAFYFSDLPNLAIVDEEFHV